MPVDGSHEPGQAKAQKHVHAVAARHIPDAVVRVLFLESRSLAREQIREWSSQSHKRNRGHAWLNYIEYG